MNSLILKFRTLRNCYLILINNNFVYLQEAFRKINISENLLINCLLVLIIRHKLGRSYGENDSGDTMSERIL